MVTILGETKPEFIVGSKVKTTPQYDEVFHGVRFGEVLETRGNIVVFKPDDKGGKEFISKDWLMPA